MSWGILGNPTPEKISEWQNMPYGEFRNMVAALKKQGKGKTLKKHKVRIRKLESTSKIAYQIVEAFSADSARDQAMVLDKSIFEWSEATVESDKYFYQVVHSE
jgi:hypothetical protein